jgi:putative salt-induced outer membrane protein
MHRFLFLCLALLASRPAFATAAPPAKLPPTVRDMLREAYPKERPTLVNIVKRLYPNSIDEIDKLVKAIDEEKKIRVTRADFIAGLRGEVSAGGYLTTGNTQEWGVTASVSIKRQARWWVHALDLRADVKEEKQQRTEERLFAGYTLRRNFAGTAWFAAGGLRAERDRFQGFDSRFGAFIGPGYQIANNDRVKWEIYGGPGFRQTRFIDAPNQSQLGMFARTVFGWEISDTLRFSEDLSAGIGKGNDTYQSTTALTTNLYGDLAIRLSFVAERESEPPAGRKKNETYTRGSLVYTFEP